MMSHASLISLVIECLHRSGEALSARELARRLLNSRAVTDVTLDSLTDRLIVALKMESETRGELARLIKHGDLYDLLDTGTYQAISADDEIGSPTYSFPNHNEHSDFYATQMGTTVKTTLQLSVTNYPLTRQVLSLLRLSHGERFSLVESLRRGLRRALKMERSAKEVQHALVDVEAWIRTHLTGGSASLAKKLWEGSGRLLVPEKFESCWALIESYQLMTVVEDGRWRMTEQGMALLGQGDRPNQEPTQSALRHIDEQEGLLAILILCLEYTQINQDALLKIWGQRLKSLGKRRSRPWLSIALRSRLKNLSDRGLVRRDLDAWRLTEEGLSWLRRGGVSAPSADQEALEQVWAALKQQRERARESIAILLDQMNPQHFEMLICELLECMGYDEVHLTPMQNDMGVDVIANIELGITSVREVIQVKRQHRAIHRPVLDALRGSLHRFDAVRGTLITTSSFSKGTREAAFERGAAPITLIDGERLIDLLMNHELGVKPINIKLWQVEPEIFEKGSQRDWPIWRFVKEN
jgi:restriction system protein